MTPITYLDYIARLFGLPGDVRKPKLATLIRAVDLLPHSGDPIAHFTPGMTARLAVAASLINEPDLLIWDEPTHGLDIEARRSMLELIKTLAAEKTLIISQPQPERRGRSVQPRVRAEQGADDLPRLAARPEGPHPQEPLRTRSRWRAEVDHESGRRAPRAEGLQAGAPAAAPARLKLGEDTSNAAVLAQLFQVLADHKVTLITVRSVGMQTEQAYLDLVEKEDQRGFARLYRDAEAA